MFEKKMTPVGKALSIGVATQRSVLTFPSETVLVGQGDNVSTLQFVVLVIRGLSRMCGKLECEARVSSCEARYWQRRRRGTSSETTLVHWDSSLCTVCHSGYRERSSRTRRTVSDHQAQLDSMIGSLDGSDW